MLLRILLVLAWVLLGAACRRPSMDDYLATCRSGLSKLKPAAQLEQHYTKVDHFITHFDFGKQPLDWQTVAFIQERFVLTVVTPVNVDYTAKTLTQACEPKFYWVAIKQLHIGSGDVVDGATLDDKLDRKFGQAEWDTFVNDGFDLTALGISRDEIRAIPRWEEYVQGWRKDRIPIRRNP